MATVIFDVGIVGFGPVGAALATLLARQGVSVCVLERDPAAYAQPRACHLDGEVMRILQAAGVADSMAPTMRVGIGMKFLAADGTLLLDWPRPQEIGPQGWHASYRFHQPELERQLRDAFARLSPHPARLGCEVTAIEQDAHGVQVAYRAGEAGPGTMRCRFLVGCDGGRSFVRRRMGVANLDLGSHERWLVVDVALARPVPALDAATLQICDPARPTTIAQGAGLRRRWEFRLADGDDAQAMVGADAVWARLKPWIGPEEAEVERAVVYTFHATLADGWRRERLLLAGDAAHQTPPFMGQGLCAGMRDVSNLAWKLAAVLRGDADAALLDSYEAERAPHAKAFILEAVRLGRIVQATDPAEVRARDRRMAESPEFLRTIAPRLGPGLHGTAPAPAGTLGAQPRLRSAERLDDVVGPRFALLLDDSLAQALGAAERDRLQRQGVVVLPGEAAEWRAELGTRAVLLRPDRYVLGTANDPDALRRLLRSIPLRQPVAAGA